MVEFALALPIFFLIVIGVLEFGHLLAVMASVYTAAREGARYGSASSTYQDCAGITAAANRVGLVAKPLTVSIGYDDANSYTGSQDPASFPADHQCGIYTINPDSTVIPRVIVKVTANFGFVLLPLNSFPISSESVRTIINNVQYAETPAQPGPASTSTPTPPVAASSTPTQTFTPTPGSAQPTPLPYCLFLSATAGSTTTHTKHNPQNYSFTINSTRLDVNVTLTRFTIDWSGGTTGHTVYLTEIDFQSYQWTPPSPIPQSASPLDTGEIANGPVIVAPQPNTPNTYYYFSSDKYDVTVINATVYMTYQDPGTHETVNCKLSPGGTAVKVP